MNLILLQFLISLIFTSKLLHSLSTTSNLSQTSKLNARNEINVDIPYKGMAVNSNLLKIDSEYRKIIEEDFEVFTPENAMKWELTEKVRGVFTFEEADEIVNYASAHNKLSRGHTIVWHQQVPSWLPELNPKDLIKATQDHLDALLNHYKGRLYAIDICNEIIEEDGSFKNTFWYQKLNKSFPGIALQTARDIDPTVKLYINDYSIEGINKKSDGLYQLSKELKTQGLLDGIGFQSHFIVGGVPKDMKENLERFVALDLDVSITELDIRIKLPPSKEDLDQQVQDYSEVVKICRSINRCVGITIWGVSYQNSWIPSIYPGMGAALLYDENYQPTKAFKAFNSALI